MEELEGLESFAVMAEGLPKLFQTEKRVLIETPPREPQADFALRVEPFAVLVVILLQAALEAFVELQPYLKQFVVRTEAQLRLLQADLVP